MNKEDEEFINLVRKVKSNDYDIILIDSKEYCSRGVYSYEKLRGVLKVDNLVTCKLFKVTGCKYLLLYGSSKEENEVECLKRLKDTIASLAKFYIISDMSKSSDRRKMVFINKFLQVSIKKRDDSEGGVAKYLMDAYERSVFEEYRWDYRWRDSMNAHRKLTFLNMDTISYFRTIVDTKL